MIDGHQKHFTFLIHWGRGYDNTDAPIFQLSDDLLDIIQHEGIKPCEFLIKQHGPWLIYKGFGISSLRPSPPERDDALCLGTW